MTDVLNKIMDRFLDQFNVNKFVSTIGRFFIFVFNSLIHIFTPPYNITRIIEQIYFIGVKSLAVICLTGFFTGMVLGLQGYYSLVKFGAEGTLGTVIALTLIRELGPVLTSIMVIGRAGSSMAAEIGIMRISEQIDALDTMNVNPVKFLVSPRLLAALISVPILTGIYDLIGIFGGYIAGCRILGLNTGVYFFRIENSTLLQDVSGGFIKSFVFAAIVIIVCSYKGFYTHTNDSASGAKGVSFSTTSAVVVSSVMVFITDYFITYILM